MHVTANTRIVPSVEKGERPMLLLVVERHPLLGVLACGRRLAYKKHRRRQCVTRFQQQHWVVLAFGQIQERLRDPGALAESRLTSNGVEPQPPKRLKELHRLADLLAQLTRARVGGLHLGRAEALHLLKSWTE